MPRRDPLPGWAALWLAASAVPAFGQGGAAPPAAMRPARLHAVASAAMFTTVNRNDAMAAIRVCFDMVNKERGFALDSRVDIVTGVAEMKQRLESRSVDILILDFTDYLQLERTGLVKPALVGTRASAGGPRYPYLLPVGPRFPSDSIRDLRGKSVIYFTRSESNTSLAWIELSLAKLELGRAESFFSSAKEVARPQACVLPLYFGNVDACVVDEISLNLLKEMNPQLAKLRPIARSAPLVDAVIAFPVEPFPYRDELVDTLLNLHASARGRQLMMVFKTGRLLPVAPGDLDAARALWTEHGRLLGPPRRVAPETAATDPRAAERK